MQLEASRPFNRHLSHDRTEEFVEGGPTGRLADTRGGGGGGQQSPKRRLSAVLPQ